MEERKGFAFAGDEQLTVMGKQLHVGDPAPDFCLDYLDLADQAILPSPWPTQEGWFTC